MFTYCILNISFLSPIAKRNKYGRKHFEKEELKGFYTIEVSRNPYIPIYYSIKNRINRFLGSSECVRVLIIYKIDNIGSKINYLILHFRTKGHKYIAMLCEFHLILILKYNHVFKLFLYSGGVLHILQFILFHFDIINFFLILVIVRFKEIIYLEFH